MSYASYLVSHISCPCDPKSDYLSHMYLYCIFVARWNGSASFAISTVRRKKGDMKFVLVCGWKAAKLLAYGYFCATVLTC